MASNSASLSSQSSAMDTYIESELCTRVLELTYAKIQNRPRKSNLRRSLMIYNVMIKAKQTQLEKAKNSRASASLTVTTPAAPVTAPVAQPVAKSQKKAAEKSRSVDGPLEYRVKDVADTSKPPRWYHRLLKLSFSTEAMAVEEALVADDVCVVPELSDQLFDAPEEEEEFDAPPTIFQSDSSSSDEEDLDEEGEDSGLGHPGRKRKTSTPRLSATAEKRYCSFENVSELDDEEEEESDECECDGSSAFFRGRSQSAPLYGGSMAFPVYGRITDQLVPGANLQIASCN